MVLTDTLIIFINALILLYFWNSNHTESIKNEADPLKVASPGGLAVNETLILQDWLNTGGKKEADLLQVSLFCACARHER